MKTVIEMAREAGLGFFKTRESDNTSVDALERFAAIVLAEREKHDSIAKYALEAARRSLKYLDAGRFTDASDYAADFWNEMEKLADWEAGISSDEREKQEPVAWAYQVGVLWKEHLSFDKPDGIIGVHHLKPLYTTPPTAALAARQMREAAVKVCTEYAELLDDMNFVFAGQSIAAMPIPGEEK